MFSLLNMSSVGQGPPTGRTDTDRTARARIRDAAIACFGRDGVGSTSVRAIATAAGVSPALVIHHFGSKDALRIACDQYVARAVREQKTSSIAEGNALDPLAALRDWTAGPPVLRYLARTLADGTPEVAELIDEMVADAVTYLDQGVQAGLIKPSADPRGRAAVLTVWSLGALVLGEHVRRLLGVDPAADGPDGLGDAQRAMAYVLPSLEILGKGVLDDGLYRQLYAQMSEVVVDPATASGAPTPEPTPEDDA